MMNDYNTLPVRISLVCLPNSVGSLSKLLFGVCCLSGCVSCHLSDYFLIMSLCSGPSKTLISTGSNDEHKANR